MKKNKSIIEILIIIACFIFLFIVIAFTPILNRYSNDGLLIINEIMPNNKNTYKDANGNHYDYIEIYNGYDESINLKGYYLSDELYDTKKWTFPEIILEPKEYLVVFASGLNKCEENGCHTNFKLSNSNEIVTLSNNQGKALSRIYYVKTLNDTSYGYNGKEYVYYYEGTPGKVNEGLYDKKPINSGFIDNSLYITEYYINNSQYKSSDNNYYSMIELYNDNEFKVSLDGYYLSDSYNDTFKYRLNGITIEPKSYKIIYTSGLNKYDEECHTNFVLNENDNIIILSDKFKNIIDTVYMDQTKSNYSIGLKDGTWRYYTNNSLGQENPKDYLTDNVVAKDLIINEVSAVGTEWIEIKNISDKDINLSNYSLSDKSNKNAKLPNITLKAGQYYVAYGSDQYLVSGDRLYTGFHINNSSDEINLYNNGILIDMLITGKLEDGISVGINDKNERALFRETTLGNKNSNNYYLGYSEAPVFSHNNIYINKDETVEIKTKDNSDIYYTLDGSFPNKNSKKYTEPIKISGTTSIKAIAIKDNYIESNVVARTYITDRKHNLSVVSITSNSSNLYGRDSLFGAMYSTTKRKINVEIYEKDGSLGIDFTGEAKLVGQDSRLQPQKSIAVYLKERYGMSEMTYPLFEDNKTVTFSSFVLRNSGENPNRIRIKDTFLTSVLKGQMDIDMQDYRAVVVYINGEYYGLYNIRDKINEDYLINNFDVEKGSSDLIKGISTVQAGTIANYNNLMNYIRANDARNPDVFNYLKSQIDIQEVANYWIVQTYYVNTDTGNIRYWKSNDGKWRIALFDQDWSLYPGTYRRMDLVYPFKPNGHGYGKYFSTMMTYKLFQNPEFRDLYLRTFAYHLKNTFNPDRMIGILDKLTLEVADEMPYHINRWYNTYKSQGFTPIASMDSWYGNLNTLKTVIRERHRLVISNLRSQFNLSTEEYNKYFGNL